MAVLRDGVQGFGGDVDQDPDTVDPADEDLTDRPGRFVPHPHNGFGALHAELKHVAGSKTVGALLQRGSLRPGRWRDGRAAHRGRPGRPAIPPAGGQIRNGVIRVVFALDVRVTVDP